MHNKGDKSNIPIEEMAEAEFYHLQKAAAIEKKIAEIQHSTKVDIAELAAWHSYLRMRFSWYYSWHLKSYAYSLHYFILIIYLGLWLWLFMRK